VYEYLKMPLCDGCTRIVRRDMRKGGHDDSQLVASLADFTGELYDGTRYTNGKIVFRGKDN
jgi:hypothetical protein